MKTTGIFLIAVAIVAALTAAVSFVFEFFWNFALEPLFGAPHLTFWYSVAIVLLLMIVGSMFHGSSSSK